ncbi:MAG: YfhO family protein [Clostridia bacterium]|nr:YfhO family protein [Clostridia bacterium]
MSDSASKDKALTLPPEELGASGMPGAEDTSSPSGTRQPGFFTRAVHSFYYKCLKPYLKDRGYLLLGAVLAMCIMYGIDIFLQIPPYGDGSVLVLDLNAQYVYFFEGLRRAIYGDASFLYSFSRSMGGEFLGIYAYYLASPFSYLVALFPQGAMQEALTTIFILKTGFLAYTFGWYLHKTHKVKSHVSVVLFSILYAFTTYAVVMQHNTMWIDSLIWLPILTYAIEQLVRFGKYKLFVVFLTLTVVSNFYIGYMVCLYVMLYFFCYCIGHGKDSSNPLGEKAHFIKSLFRIGFWSLIAIGISLFMIWSAYYSLTFGKTTFSTTNWKPSYRFEIHELLVKFFPGTYDTVEPAGLPFVYCGVLTLMLIPVYFLHSKSTHREKIGYALLCLILLFSFTISSADIFWHGFQKPNWLNYRYAFLLTFLLLVMAFKAYNALEENHKGTRWLFLSGVGVLGVIAWLQTVEGSELDKTKTILFTILAVVLYLCLVPFSLTRKKSGRVASGVLLFVIVAEVFLNAIICLDLFDKDVAYTHYSYYQNYNEKIREIMEITMTEDPTFYRMEKTTERKKNDAFVFGMRGVAGSTSTLNQSTLDFLNKIGYPAASHWSYYYSGSPLNDSLLGIKYVASDKPIDNSVYKLAYSDSADYYASFLNPYALSIATGADEAFVDFDIDSYGKDVISRLNGIYSALVGSEEELQIFKPISYTVSHTGLASSNYGEHYVRYTKLNSYDENSLNLFFYLDKDTDVFLYMGSDYPRSVKLTVNGNTYASETDVMTKRIISLGTQSANLPVLVGIQPNDTDFYLLQDIPALYTIDYELFGQVIEKLNRQALITSEKSNDDTIRGTMHIDRDNTPVFTSIAYDEGWKVYIDGERTAVFESMNALLAFRADAGDHEVVLKYRPNCIVYGSLISLVFAVFFLAFCALEKKLFRIRLIRALFRPIQKEPVPAPEKAPEEQPDTETEPEVTPVTDEAPGKEPDSETEVSDSTPVPLEDHPEGEKEVQDTPVLSVSDEEEDPALHQSPNPSVPQAGKKPSGKRKASGKSDKGGTALSVAGLAFAAIGAIILGRGKNK